MPTTSAVLSLVPNTATAMSFNDAANRSMNCVPTAVTSDGPSPRSPHTSSPAAGGAGGDDERALGGAGRLTGRMRAGAPLPPASIAEAQAVTVRPDRRDRPAPLVLMRIRCQEPT